MYLIEDFFHFGEGHHFSENSAVNFQEGRGSVLSSSLSNTYVLTHERTLQEYALCGFIVSMTSEYKSINYSSTLESRE